MDNNNSDGQKPTPDNNPNPDDQYAITEDDLVFDCPFCGRNFVIDKQAAGRTFPCPGCDRDIEIPPIEDLLSNNNDDDHDEPDDETNSESPDNLDANDQNELEEEDVRVLDLQHALDQAHEEISMLKSEIDELRFRRRFLEKEKAENARMVEDLNDQLRILRATMDQMTDTLRSTEKRPRDTQQIG